MVRLRRDAVRPAPLPVRARGACSSERFPADFICEAQDQTRGWFYSLLAVATLLGDAPAPYNNVVCLGLILDEEAEDVEVARATRSSRGRCSTPTAPTPSAGTSSPPSSLGRLPLLGGDDRRGRAAVPQAAVVDLLLLRRSTRSAAGSSRDAGRGDRPAATARGADRRPRPLGAVAHRGHGASWCAERLDAYDATSAGRAIAELVDELSNWYVRRSRRRFWDGEPAAFETLRTCLLTVAKLLAPFCPFIADEIYDNLDGDARERAPVRLPDGRRAAARATRSSRRRWRSRARRCASGWARAARPRSRCASRCGEAVVVADGRERAAIERLADVVREELNVQARALRRRRRGARQLRGQGQLPHARPAVRQGHAAGGRGDRGARPARAWPRRCATAAADRDRGRRARAHALGRGRDPHDAGRPRATASSARAPTPSRST